MKILSANLSSWQVIFVLMLCNRKSLRNLLVRSEPDSYPGSSSEQVYEKKPVKVYFKLSTKTLLLGRICVAAFSSLSLKAT